MKQSRIAILFSAGALALAPAMVAQGGPGKAFAFASQTGQTTQARQQRPGHGQRHILELMADRLDFSDQQKLQLNSLLERQQQMISALHQNTQVDDQQKQTQSQQIRQQTKEQFVAMLTPEQRRQFGWMLRESPEEQPAQNPAGNGATGAAQPGANSKSQVSPAVIDQILNSAQSDNSAPASGDASPK